MPQAFFDLSLLAIMVAKLGNTVGKHVKCCPVWPTFIDHCLVQYPEDNVLLCPVSIIGPTVVGPGEKF